jgi:hypothetical protein
MLRHAFPAVLSALVLSLIGCLPARAADADKGIKEIIAKAIEARGGAAVVEKYKAGTASFKGALSLMGMELAMSGTTKDQSPDKLRLDMTVTAGGQNITITQIVNGTKGWQGLNGNFSEMDKGALAEAREQFHSSQLTDLRGLTAKGIKLASLGESKVDDKPVVGVRVSADGYRDVSLFFDKDSGQLLKSETKGKDPMNGGADFKAESLYSDYKKVSGLSVPHKVRVIRDGTPFMVMEVSSVVPLEKIDDKEFAKP